MGIGDVLRFAIVTRHDCPVYEVDFMPPKPGQAIPSDKTPYIQQLVLHASLDNIEDMQWTPANFSGYMKNVDAFGKSVVSALVSPGNTKLLLLHSNHKQSEEATRMFLVEAGELYMKVMLNPLRDPDAKITSPKFHSAIVHLAKRMFNV